MALAMALACAGCGQRKVPSGEDYYTQAQAYYSMGEYRGAIDNYQHLIDQYPFSPYAEEAELRIGLSYYKMGDHAEAVASFSDFQRMHPTSKNLALATYYLGMTYYNRVGRPDRDQSNTALALQQFEIIEQRFPESEFGELARQRIVICRDLLARNELYIGDFYDKKANFRAGESRMAELMEKYPDTPVAPEALYKLGVALEKEGKKYSAAQAFTALTIHYPKSNYMQPAKAELAKLKQPVDTEDDPLRMVLAESGFNPDQSSAFDREVVRTRFSSAADLAEGAYGADGLPVLTHGPAHVQTASAEPDEGGPVTLRLIRLSSADPPLSVILDLSGPVKYDKEFQGGSNSAVLTMHLKNTEPGRHLVQHLVFDKSIFRDVLVSTEGNDTTVTVNTTAVSRFAIVPLEEPARLLVTFAPPDDDTGQAAASEMGPMPSGPSADGPPPGADDSAAPDAGSEPPSENAPDMPPGSSSDGAPDLPSGQPVAAPGP
ncbi:MAG TPA: outer membrane protein assembly factor BamD [Candidatus Binataceae bacterium]|nr:outer membrane protein assembly factor BamD [Candidatus Binataceae bacterium]